MSNFRQRAAEIRQAGADRRENWSPSIDGTSYKVYRWWLRQNGKKISRENFCHYWRVVLIWAPFRWLMVPLLGLIALAILLLAGWLIAQYTSIVVSGALVLVTAAYLYLGWKVFFQLIHDLNRPNDQSDDFRWKWLDSKDYVVKAALIFVTLPVGLCLAILAMSFGSLGTVLVGLGAKYGLYERVGRWFMETHFTERRPFSWLRPWLLFPVAVAVTYYQLPATRDFIFWAGVYIGCVVVFVLLVFLCCWLDDVNKRRIKTKRASMPVNYNNHFGEVEEQAPGRFSRFMSAISSFLALIWAAILAWKWGICPLVEFPTEEVSLEKAAK